MRKYNMQKILLAAVCAWGLTGCQASTAASDSSQEAEPITGGWAVNTGSLSMADWPEAEAAFGRVEQPVDGMAYEAIAVLGTQIVAGTNYSILARGTSLEGDKTIFVVLVLYAGLEEDVQIIREQELTDTGNSFVANTGPVQLDQHPEVLAAFDKAEKELGDQDVESVAYFGSEEGQDPAYVVLVRAFRDGQPEFVLVTVGLDGTLVAQKTLNLSM